MPAPQVTMYRTSWCGYCARAQRLLESKGVNFESIDIEAEPRRRAEMQQRSGGTSVPQIFIGSTHVGGYDDLRALEEAGRLDPLLHDETDQMKRS